MRRTQRADRFTLRWAGAALGGLLALAGLDRAALAAPPFDEQATIAAGLAVFCDAYFKPGASRDPEKYGEIAKAAGWEMRAMPGAVVFNAEGAWGRARVLIDDGAEGDLCRISVFSAPGVRAPHDAAPALSAVAAWLPRSLPKAQKLKERARPDKGPSDARETLWRAAKTTVLLREQSPQPLRPVVQIDVLRAP